MRMVLCYLLTLVLFYLVVAGLGAYVKLDPSVFNTFTWGEDERLIFGMSSLLIGLPFAGILHEYWRK
jgi:hypothetical protein